jgi:hypothetical protein
MWDLSCVVWRPREVLPRGKQRISILRAGERVKQNRALRAYGDPDLRIWWSAALPGGAALGASRDAAKNVAE